MRRPTSQIKIEIGEQMRALLFDGNAHADFREATGQELLAVLTQLHEAQKSGEPITPGNLPLSTGQIRAMLWAGLRHQDERLTVRQVGSWFDVSSLGRVLQACLEAFAASMPAPEEGRPQADRPTEGSVTTGQLGGNASGQ